MSFTRCIHRQNLQIIKFTEGKIHQSCFREGLYTNKLLRLILNMLSVR